jgi:thiol-disulfide isomerase/thioredoxin
MKVIYCFMIVLCPTISIAQTAPVLKPLSIGDNIPNLVFSSVLNAPYTSTSIAAHPGKLLLLDFWATWCASCIEAFPKLDSLQRAFDGRLQVLLVNNYKSGDNTEKINLLLRKVNKRSRLPFRLPIAIGDSAAAHLFPHNSIPHTVWIWQGKVVGITAAEDVSAANITAVMQGDYSSLDLKADPVDFDFDKPLLEGGNGGDLSMLLSRSFNTS